MYPTNRNDPAKMAVPKKPMTISLIISYSYSASNNNTNNGANIKMKASPSPTFIFLNSAKNSIRFFIFSFFLFPESCYNPFLYGFLFVAAFFGFWCTRWSEEGSDFVHNHFAFTL